MKPLSSEVWLRHLFLNVGFFLLGAYLPSILTWLIIVSPQVSQKQALPTLILAGLALLQVLAFSVGGIVGLVLLARFQQANTAYRHPVAIVILASIGYLLAVSIVL